MKTLLKKAAATGLTAFTLLTFSASSFAEEGAFSAGFKFGNMDPDEVSSETAMGFQLGYGITDNITAEFEFLRAEFDTILGDRDLDSKAIYATYRTDGELYLVGKVGYASLDIASESESGLSFGIGGGYSVNDSFDVEVEYTILEDDVNFLGLTAKYNFQH